MSAVEARLGMVIPPPEPPPASVPQASLASSGLPPTSPPPLPERFPSSMERIDEERVKAAPVSRLDYSTARTVAGSVGGQSGLEREIGLKWAGWIGAAALIIGMGLGIRYAYEQQWFDVLSPMARVGLMSLVGLALLGMGEWVYRRVHVISAAALFGAGVGTLFLVAYAGYGYYSLYLRQTAFALMIGVMMIGAIIAARGKLASIAVLSLIGGHLAPIALETVGRGNALLIYLFMLHVVALAMAARGGGGRWWAVRGMSFALICLWWLVLSVIHHQASERAIPLTMAIASVAVFQAELILLSLRRDAGMNRAQSSLAAMFSLIATAALAAGTLLSHYSDEAIVRGAWMIGYAGACAGLGLVLSRHAASGARTMATGFFVQGTLLLIVTVPVMWSGAGVVCGWLGLSIAFITLARTLKVDENRSSHLKALAIGAFTLATMKWVMLDVLWARLGPGWSADAMTPLINPITLSAGAIVATAWGVCRFSRQGRTGAMPGLPFVATLTAAVLFICVTVEIDRAFELMKIRGTASDPDQARQVAMSVGWAILAAGAIVAGFAWRLAPLRYGALGLFAMTLLKVVLVDLAGAGTGYRILSFLGVGALLLGTSVVYGKLSPRLLRRAISVEESPRAAETGDQQVIEPREAGR